MAKKKRKNVSQLNKKQQRLFRNKEIEKLNRQLKTWQKNNPKKYEDIKILIESNNLKLTKEGLISKQQVGKGETFTKNVQNLSSQYRMKYGSYTKYIRKMKESYKQTVINNMIMDEPLETFTSFKDYLEKTERVDTALSDMWRNGPGNSADKRIVHEEALDMPTQQALERIKKYMNDGPQDAEDYNSSKNNPTAAVLEGRN